MNIKLWWEHIMFETNHMFAGFRCYSIRWNHLCYKWCFHAHLIIIGSRDSEVIGAFVPCSGYFILYLIEFYKNFPQTIFVWTSSLLVIHKFHKILWKKWDAVDLQTSWDNLRQDVFNKHVNINHIYHGLTFLNHGQ